MKKPCNLALLDNEWQNAINAAQWALRSKLDDEALFVWFTLNLYLMHKTYWGTAEATMTNALVVSRNYDYAESVGAALANLGNIYEYQGRWEEAVDAFNQAKSIFCALGNEQLEGQTLSNLGVVYDSQGRWQDAVKVYLDSLAIFHNLDDQHNEGFTLNNLGIIYRRQNRWLEAMDAFEKSLTIFRALGDQHLEGQVLANIGTLYEKQGRWQEALEAYEHDLVSCRAVGDKHGEGFTLGNIAITWANQGNKSAAIIPARQSLDALLMTEDTIAIEKAKRLIVNIEAI